VRAKLMPAITAEARPNCNLKDHQVKLLQAVDGLRIYKTF
jgi:hypothetical protein